MSHAARRDGDGTQGLVSGVPGLLCMSGSGPQLPLKDHPPQGSHAPWHGLGL